MPGAFIRSRQPVDHTAPPAPEPLHIDGFTLTRRFRFWEVRDPTGELVCTTVYKCGGMEVIKRLSEKEGEADASAKGNGADKAGKTRKTESAT